MPTIPGSGIALSASTSTGDFGSSAATSARLSTAGADVQGARIVSRGRRHDLGTSTRSVTTMIRATAETAAAAPAARMAAGTPATITGAAVAGTTTWTLRTGSATA